MNSNSPDAVTDLLGRAQPYNDTFLRKRVTCLGSGLLLCFIIAGAGLGISIIVLLKFEGTAGVFPQYAANQTVHMKALKDQLKLIQQQVEALKKEVDSHGKTYFSANKEDDPRMLDIDSSGSFGMDHEEHMAPLGKDESVPAHDNPAEIHEHHSVKLETSTTIHNEHKHHNGHDENAPDKGNFPSEDGKDATTKITDPHAHHRSNHDHHGSMTQPFVDSPTKELHEHHGPMTEPEVESTSINELHNHHGPMTEPEVESPSINELLCDDSDGCLPFVDTGSGIVPIIDGSGEFLNEGEFMDDIDLSDFSGVDAVEGSGDCIQYSRPMCPRNFKICYTDDPCPIPICCYP